MPEVDISQSWRDSKVDQRKWETRRVWGNLFAYGLL